MCLGFWLDHDQYQDHKVRTGNLSNTKKVRTNKLVCNIFCGIEDGPGAPRMLADVGQAYHPRVLMMDWYQSSGT